VLEASPELEVKALFEHCSVPIRLWPRPRLAQLFNAASA